MDPDKYKLYYDLVIKKWFYMSALISAVYPLVIVFILLEPKSLSWTLVEAYSLSAVLSVILWCLFWEWRYSENISSFWGEKFEKIIHTSIKRSVYLSPTELNQRYKSIVKRVIIIGVLGVFSWVFPNSFIWYLVATLIGDSYCKLVVYQLDEEKHAPKQYRQPFTTVIGLLGNLVMLGAGYFVVVAGFSFYNDSFAVYWYYIAGACALGAFVAVVSELPSVTKFYRSQG
ncbi:hypothetical protein [Vibrio furnissii]|uniref:hypothetical protein n=1 Tax=Vibrio furnissii TaxID=29494 RepID=UPI0005A53D6A|nr:hypothetical protein [Vibrio furnissii]